MKRFLFSLMAGIAIEAILAGLYIRMFDLEHPSPLELAINLLHWPASQLISLVGLNRGNNWDALYTAVVMAMFWTLLFFGGTTLKARRHANAA